MKKKLAIGQLTSSAQAGASCFRERNQVQLIRQVVMLVLHDDEEFERVLTLMKPMSLAYSRKH